MLVTDPNFWTFEDSRNCTTWKENLPRNLIIYNVDEDFGYKFWNLTRILVNSIKFWTVRRIQEFNKIDF